MTFISVLGKDVEYWSDETRKIIRKTNLITSRKETGGEADA